MSTFQNRASRDDASDPSGQLSGASAQQHGAPARQHNSMQAKSSFVHEQLDEAQREQAALYVLDALDEAQELLYSLHLRACSACSAEVASLTAAASELCLLAPEEAPNESVWRRVLERVRDPATHADDGDEASCDSTSRRSTAAAASKWNGQIWKSWQPSEPAASASAASFTYCAGEDGAFEPTTYAGVEARRLFVDAANERVTMLIRMAPGSSYPAHVHGGAEECFVLRGELQVGDELRMRSGDFQRAEAGSVHPVQSTDVGCELLIVSSLHDELLT